MLLHRNRYVTIERAQRFGRSQSRHVAANDHDVLALCANGRRGVERLNGYGLAGNEIGLTHAAQPPLSVVRNVFEARTGPQSAVRIAARFVVDQVPYAARVRTTRAQGEYVQQEPPAAVIGRSREARGLVAQLAQLGVQFVRAVMQEAMTLSDGKVGELYASCTGALHAGKSQTVSQRDLLIAIDHEHRLMLGRAVVASNVDDRAKVLPPTDMADPWKGPVHQIAACHTPRVQHHRLDAGQCLHRIRHRRAAGKSCQSSKATVIGIGLRIEFATGE